MRARPPAADDMPVNPSAPAMTEITKKTNAHLSMLLPQPLNDTANAKL
jgi:hypothetical protein